MGTPHLSSQSQSYQERGRHHEGAARTDSERESELSVVSPELPKAIKSVVDITKEQREPTLNVSQN